MASVAGSGVADCSWFLEYHKKHSKQVGMLSQVLRGRQPPTPTVPDKISLSQMHQLATIVYDCMADPEKISTVASICVGKSSLQLISSQQSGKNKKQTQIEDLNSNPNFDTSVKQDT